MNKFLLIQTFAIIHTFGLSAQHIIFNKTKSDFNEKVEFKIKANKEIYNLGDTIWINYEFRNISDSIQMILIKEDWLHPMGMTASIIDDKNLSICKHSTKSIYSSQIYSEEQLKDYYQKIKPKSKVSGKVALQHIPVFKDNIKNDVIPVGVYKVNLGYFVLRSNTIVIEIK